MARAFIKKPRVLIFDEATSALDKRNEAEVQQAIDHMKAELGSVTTIVIAHRLSTVRSADRIIVMKKGRIAEDGNHESLLRDYPSGVYAKLNADQAKSDAKEAQKEEEKKRAAADADNYAAIDAPPMSAEAELGKLGVPAGLLDATKGQKGGSLLRRQSTAALGRDDIKETDPQARRKMVEAEERRQAYVKDLEHELADVLD